MKSRVSRKRTGNKGVSGAVGMVLMVLALPSGALLCYILYLHSRVWLSKESSCTILWSKAERVVSSDISDAPYEFSMRYSAERDGQRIEFERGPEGSEPGWRYSQFTDAYRHLLRFPAGSRVPCYLDSSDRDAVYFTRRVPWEGVLLVVPLAMLVAGFRKMSGATAGAECEDPIADAKKSRNAFAGLLFLFLATICVSLVPLYDVVLVPLVLTTEVGGWIKTDCTVLASEAVRVTSSSTRSDGPRKVYAFPDIFYSYSVEGVTYRSNRYGMVADERDDPSNVDALVDAKPVGSTFPCFYDPEDPVRSIVDRHFHVPWGHLLLCLPFLAVGLLGILVLTLVWVANLGTRRAASS